MPPSKSMELRFPKAGVNRRLGFRDSAGQREYFAPWGSNVRVYDNIDRRLRGGSRPGLTKYSATDFGTTIADIVSVNTSSASGGASSILVVMADSTLKTVEGGATSTPVAYLTDESGNNITDGAGAPITVGTAAPPSSGFLVAGDQHAYAVTTSGITKMNPKTGESNTLVATGGTIPTNCTFGAIYRDRFCLSGQDNAIYMSRMGDYGDWNYGAHVNDSSRPLAFQLGLAAEVGPLPTALIPHKDSFLIAATANTLWVVSGDPAADGTLRRISENIGIVSSRAWTKVEDTIFFLSSEGVYRIQADGSGLAPLSESAVPEELRDIDPSATTISMGFEQSRMAIHVFLRTAGGSDDHWVYEAGSEAWWPVRFATDDHSPLAVEQHDGELLLAGNDGYVRKVGGDDDDGVSVTSHVAIGPIRIGTQNSFGRLLKLHGMLAAGSGTVTWRVVTGDTAEEAADNVKTAIETFQSGGDYSSYVKSKGEWTEGRSVMAYPRMRAVWGCVWIESSSKWAFEGCAISVVQSGRWRGA